MSKILRYVLLVGLIVCATMVYAGGQRDTGGQVTLRLGSSMADGTVEVNSAREFGRLLEQYSGGTMKVEFLVGGLGGGERQILLDGCLINHYGK